MAIQYNKIIESTTEPATNNLWLKDGKLYYYKGGWKPLTQEENMSTEDLKLLTSEYVDGRQAIATALTNRRYPTEPSESFHAMALKIKDMDTKMGVFEKFGYTEDNSDILTRLEYSYNISEYGKNNLASKPFKDNANLLCVANMDFSLVSDMSAFFANCPSLIATSIIDANSTMDMGQCFSGCSALSRIEIRNTSKCKSFGYSFQNCKSLTRINYLDFSSISNLATPFSGDTNLVFINIRNLGQSSTSLDLSSATNWGVGSEENRQSLIDSLITYSYDRASNGMSTCTIKLSTNTKALLTEVEIAQITNKGFTIA